jgi:hypothetical protein
MRLHISLDDELVVSLDERVGKRQRSAFIATTLRRALEDERRWDDVIASIGVLEPRGHDWDDDPATWIRASRHADAYRVG